MFFPHVIPAKAGIQEVQCVMDSGSPRIKSGVRPE